MPIPLLELARESFFRPKTAAPELIGLNIPRNKLIEAAMLLAVLTVLSQYLLFLFIQAQGAGAWGVSFSVPFVDVGLQFANAFIASQIVVLMARVLRVNVSFVDSLVVYLWFNLLLIVLMGLMIATSFFFGIMGIVIILFTIFWGPYTLAVFWSELLETKNLLLGFVVAVVAFLLASAVLVIIAGILGLPVMGIIQNV